MINIIAAITSDKAAIGRKGDMLYHVSADLRRFKALTTGHTVIMGRKTFESLPKGALPNRRNIVVTRNMDFSAVNVEVAHSLEEALEMCKLEQEVYIMGGGEIYATALPIADRLVLTMLEAPTPADADAFFPQIDPQDWEIEQMEATAVDERSGVTYRFIDFRRSEKVCEY